MDTSGNLRKALLLPLDDLLVVVREFLNSNVSRSRLDRYLRRHGAGNLRDLKLAASRPAHKAFKAYAPGYIHIDVKSYRWHKTVLRPSRRRRLRVQRSGVHRQVPTTPEGLS